jgi:hypothetical protein
VAKLVKAVFDNIDIEPTLVYSIEHARTLYRLGASTSMRLARGVEDKLISAFVRAFERANPESPAAAEVVFDSFAPHCRRGLENPPNGA